MKRGFDELNITQFRSGKIGNSHGPTAKIGARQIGHDIGVALAPGVPDLIALLQEGEMVAAAVKEVGILKACTHQLCIAELGEPEVSLMADGFIQGRRAEVGAE